MRRGTTLLAALLSGAMLMGIAAGCGGNTQTTTTGASGTAAPTTAAPAAEKKIRVAWWGNQVRNDGTVAVLNLYSEKNPGITFETEFTDWTGYWDKMATQAAAGSLPDIIQQDYKYYVQYQSKDQLASMNPFVESGVLNIADASENIIESGKLMASSMPFVSASMPLP